MTRQSRRGFLTVTALAAGFGAVHGRVASLLAQAAVVGRRIVRQAAPEFITPNDAHYVRCHFAVPQVDPATWTLQVRGAVGQPLTLTLDQLRALPKTSRVVTIECAGNGRSFLNPAVSGVQWDRGAVSTAEWTGVRLVDLLGKAGSGVFFTSPLSSPSKSTRVASVAAPSTGGEVRRGTTVDVVGLTWRGSTRAT